MKTLIIVLFNILVAVGYQTVSSKVEQVSTNVKISISTAANIPEVSEIRKIDFQNFTFPWTKTFGYGEKTFTLKNGKADLADDRKLSLESISYIDVADGYDQALVIVNINDGNATDEMLYVFAIEKNKPKLLESFEFSDDVNMSLRTAFAAHGELVIETYNQQGGDAKCCPGVVEISYYNWAKDKFVLQGEPQRILNGYVERQKKRNNPH